MATVSGHTKKSKTGKNVTIKPHVRKDMKKPIFYFEKNGKTIPVYNDTVIDDTPTCPDCDALYDHLEDQHYFCDKHARLAPPRQQTFDE